jgi:hypothetical protein
LSNTTSWTSCSEIAGHIEASFSGEQDEPNEKEWRQESVTVLLTLNTAGNIKAFLVIKMNQPRGGCKREPN